MKKYVLKRLITLVPILIGISVVAFLLVRIMPGDAATAYLTNANIPVTEKNIQIAIKYWTIIGLSKPRIR